MKENVIVGRLIPAGTGFAHHAERRRTREQDLAAQLQELESQESIEDKVAAELQQVDSEISEAEEVAEVAEEIVAASAEDNTATT